MTRDNFNRVLRAFQKRTPFKPFTVDLINGDRVKVEHPEALVFQNGVAVYVSPEGPITIFDHEGVNDFHDTPVAQTGG